MNTTRIVMDFLLFFTGFMESNKIIIGNSVNFSVKIEIIYSVPIQSFAVCDLAFQGKLSKLFELLPFVINLR